MNSQVSSQFFFLCNEQLTLIDSWFSPSHTMASGLQELEWMIKVDAFDCATILSKVPNVYEVGQSYHEVQLKEFRDLVAEWIAFNELHDAVFHWDVAVAPNFGVYGTDEMETVPSMLSGILQRVERKFRRIHEAFEAGGFGNNRFELNDEWQTILVEANGVDWFKRMTTNASVWRNLFAEKVRDRYGLGEFDADSLRKALRREWKIVGSKLKEPTAQENRNQIARRYFELEQELGTKDRQKRYQSLSFEFAQAGYEFPADHDKSKLKSILSGAANNGITRKSVLGKK